MNWLKKAYQDKGTRWVIVFLLLTSCNDFIDSWDAYEIRKGEHFSHRTGLPRRLISLTDGRHLRFDSYFTNSCLYNLSGMGVDSFDINKLYGFTDSYSLVHENSVRFGWRHDGKGTIEIFAYFYSDGEAGSEKMGETLPYTVDNYDIWARNDTYNFRFNEVEFSTVRSLKREHGIRARLFPYFGGNAPSPNDMIIHIFEYN